MNENAPAAPRVAGLPDRCRLISRALAVILSALGLVVLCGWASDVTLASLLSWWQPVKANNALALVLGGAAVILLQEHGPERQLAPGRVRLARACALTMVVVGGLTLGEHITGRDLKIDELVARTPSTVVASGPIPPARMSPLAALDVVLTGVALGLLSAPATLALAHVLLVASAAISLLSILGLLYGATFVFGVASWAHLPMHTGGAWLLLVIAALFARPEQGVMGLVTGATPGGAMVRWMVPAAALIPIVLGFLRMAGERAGLWDAAFGASLSTVVLSAAFFLVIWRNALSLDETDELRRRAQEDLAAARDEAVRASAAKTDFLANMSHEIRTPMNGVLGMTTLLLDTELTPLQRDHALTVRRCANSLLDIVNDILDFSKVEAGKLVLEPIPFDMEEVLWEAGEVVALRAEEKNLELVLRVVPDTPRWLIGDPGRVRQILVNLLANAVKFTERGRVVATVRLDDRPASDEGRRRFLITVKDTGIGISEEQRRGLFQKFQQADASTTRRYGGTGLGLAIVRQLVALMDGAIDVDSEAGQGSTFWFTLELPVAPEPSGSALMPPAGMRVLLVDDDEVMRAVLVEQLRERGIEPEAAKNSAEGLLALRAAADHGRPFEVAVLDQKMPGTDGVALGETIATDKRLGGLGLVMLTTLSARPSGDASPFADWLNKPARPVALVEAILAARKLPAREAVRRPPAARAAATSRPGLPAGVTRGRALVVEDNPVNQIVARKMLEKLGCTVDVAAHGGEALDMLAAATYDVVFMDCQMPVLDGYAATGELRRREGSRREGLGRRTPIVGMTAHAMAGDRERCLSAGMDDYVTKPITPAVLDATLARWLQPVSQPGARPTAPHSLAGLRARGDAAPDLTIRIAAPEPPPPAAADIPTSPGARPNPPSRPGGLVFKKGGPMAPISKVPVTEQPPAANLLPVPNTTEPTLDASTMDGLKVMAGEAAAPFLTKLTETFVSSGEKLLGLLRAAVEKGDAQATKEAAHALKGSCLNLGCKRGAQIASWLEDRSREGKAAELALTVPEIEAEVRKAGEALQAYIRALK